MTKNTKRTISTLSALLTMAILARMVQLIERESAYEQLFRPSSGHVPAGKRKVTISLQPEPENGETVAIQSPDSENQDEPTRPIPDVSVEESETGETESEIIAYEPRNFDSIGILSTINENNAITGYAFSPENGEYKTPISRLNHLLYRANPLIAQKDEKMAWGPECMVLFSHPEHGRPESGIITYEGTNKDSFSIMYLKGENFHLRGKAYKAADVCDVINITYSAIIGLPSRAQCDWISKHQTNVSTMHKQLEEDIKTTARELAEERESRAPVIYGATRVHIAKIQQAMRDCKKARPAKKQVNAHFGKKMYQEVFDVIRLRVRLDRIEIIQPVIVLDDTGNARIENQITASLGCKTESVFSCNIPLSLTEEILRLAHNMEILSIAYDGEYCILSQSAWKSRLLVTEDNYLWGIRSPNELQLNSLYNPQEPTEPTGESGANEAPPPEPESTPEPEPVDTTHARKVHIMAQMHKIAQMAINCARFDGVWIDPAHPERLARTQQWINGQPMLLAPMLRQIQPDYSDPIETLHTIVAYATDIPHHNGNTLYAWESRAHHIACYTHALGVPLDGLEPILKTVTSRPIVQYPFPGLVNRQRKIGTGAVQPTPEPEPAQSCEICGQIAVNHIDDHHLCDTCHIRALDYEDKLQARLARLQDRAEKATKEARAEIDAAHRKADMIPFGQPILVGHHSEKRDRAFRRRIENGYRRGFEALERGKRLQSRADRIEKQQASEDPRRRYNPISSDDPIAIIKLREKIEALEADQERMKFYNVHTRKALKLPESERMAYLVQTLECKEKTAQNMLEPDFAGRYGIPDYALKNNNANIRRLKQRLADMEAEAKNRAVLPDVIEEESPVEGLTIKRDTVQNRLQLLFPGKPDDKTRAFLKSCGFRWSPQNKAWQRQLNQSAEWAAQRVIAHLQGEE